MKNTVTLMGGEVKPLQKQTVKNNRGYYNNPNITKDLIKSVSGTVVKIDMILATEVKTSLQLGEALGVLKLQIKEFICKGHERDKAVFEGKARRAFRDFIQHRFKFGESRANEYMSVAERKDIRKLKLPICALIELSRLSPDKVQTLLKAYSVRELRQKSFKDIKSIIREINPRSRTRMSTKAIANRLKSTFGLVKEELTKSPKIEPDLDNVLSEITSWYQLNKSTAKKAA